VFSVLHRQPPIRVRQAERCRRPPPRQTAAGEVSAAHHNPRHPWRTRGASPDTGLDRRRWNCIAGPRGSHGWWGRGAQLVSEGEYPSADVMSNRPAQLQPGWIPAGLATASRCLGRRTSPNFSPSPHGLPVVLAAVVVASARGTLSAGGRHRMASTAWMVLLVREG
jgi:hypothetical protein